MTEKSKTVKSFIVDFAALTAKFSVYELRKYQLKKIKFFLTYNSFLKIKVIAPKVNFFTNLQSKITKNSRISEALASFIA